MFVFTDIGPATNAVTLNMIFSTDGGSHYNLTKTSTYFRAESDASFGYESGHTLDSATSYAVISAELGNGSDASTSGVLYLWSPSNSTFVKIGQADSIVIVPLMVLMICSQRGCLIQMSI